MAQFYSAKRRVTTRQTMTVTISDLDPFGQGVARYHGKAWFVAGALPGEQAEVEIVEEKRQFGRAKAIRILFASPERTEPRCPHFRVCGGCQQQHASQALQQQSKAKALSHLLTRETGKSVQVDEIIGGHAYGYRRRARFSLFYQTKKQHLQMGFRQASSKALAEIKQCPILKDELNALIQPLSDCLSQLQGVRQLGHVELVLAARGPFVVLRHLGTLNQADRQKLEQFSQKQQTGVFLAPDSEQVTALCAEMPFYPLGNLRLSFSPRDFIQVNDEINLQMVDKALAWLDPQPDERVLDLFCGMGNFTLPLAKKAFQVVGVEGVAALVAQGEYNASQNGLNNVTFFHENLAEDVSCQPWAAQGFAKILLDPARAGAAGVMPAIVHLSPRRVVYVSCNPTTLARDSQQLLAAGYRLEKIAMLDMFPHTGHLESMVLFSKE